MSTATQGRAREYRVRDALKEHGWVPIMRASASKGPADLLLACPRRGPILVQVGTDSKSLGPAARVRFVGAADMCRAVPVLATVTRAGIEYREVLLATAQHWPVWDPAHFPAPTLPLAAGITYAGSTPTSEGDTMNAETIRVRVRDLLDAQTAAKAIEETRGNFHEVRAVTGTLDRILREAAALGEPAGDDTVGADL